MLAVLRLLYQYGYDQYAYDGSLDPDHGHAVGIVCWNFTWNPSA